MQRFTPSLFERLFDDHASSPGTDHLLRGLSIEQMKASVARDLEALLNSRLGVRAEMTAGFPHARSSILTFGLRDFAGMSFESPLDQRTICEAISQTIERHEPRLRNVSVELINPDRHLQLLNFAVKAMLVLDPAYEPVSFDAYLQPMTQKYDVALSGR
jgi:type VI secretion system protein ImpF